MNATANINEYVKSFRERETVLLARATELGMEISFFPRLQDWQIMHNDPEQYLRDFTCEVNTLWAKRRTLEQDHSWMTREQVRCYLAMIPKWARLGPPQQEGFGGKACMVQCFYSNGQSMWIGIEPDGYAHS